MGDETRPNRHSIRWQGYDYSSLGAYFVTVCTFGRRCCLARVEDGEVQLLPAGRIVAARWAALPRHFAHVVLDVFVVMPNHIHGVLFFTEVDADAGDAAARDRQVDRGGAGDASAGWRDGDRVRRGADASPLPAGAPPGSLGAVVGSLKSTSTRRVNRALRTPGRELWQRGYHDRVVRDERELDAIRAYIAENPLNWALDHENPDAPRQSNGTT